jgi:hypothetical protein
MVTPPHIPPQKIPAFNKKKVVVQYFDAIGERYDLADTLMSFGLHFLWRRAALKHLAPCKRIPDPGSVRRGRRVCQPDRRHRNQGDDCGL